jgi:hypothetical protein
LCDAFLYQLNVVFRVSINHAESLLQTRQQLFRFFDLRGITFINNLFQ